MLSGTHARALRGWLPVVAALGLALAGPVGCASLELTGLDDAAAGDAPIRTSADRYTLRSSGGGLAVEIPIRFRNVTDRTIYIVNCRGDLAPTLEKRVGEAWQPFWAGVQLLCLSPPIVIAPGESIERTVPVWGALPPSNAAPEFGGRDVDGTYRMVLHNVVFDYDDRQQGFGTAVPLEHRVSNAFELRR